jgi:putative oxidoreductase
VWACQIIAAVQFLLTGLDKMTGAPAMVRVFDLVGLGQWLRIVTGSLEVFGAVLLFVPPFMAAGAGLLAIVMIGAITAHLTVLPFPPYLPLALLAMVGVVFWYRRRELTSLVP